MSGSFYVSVLQGAISNSIFVATNVMHSFPSAMGLEGDLTKLIASLTTIQTMLPDAPNRITESELARLMWGLDIRGEMTIQTMLPDAPNRITESELARLMWGLDIRGEIWRLENLLDEISYEALRFTVETQNHTMNKVRSCLNLSNRLPFRFNRARKLRNILSYLDDICEQGHACGLREADQTIINDISEPSEFRPTIPLFVDDSEVVGRQDDVNAVVEMLLGSDMQEGPSVIAIVGMVGLGKTTLAQLVYKHDKVVNNFGNERMWVSGFSDFNVERILNEMVTSLTRVKSESPNIQGVVRKLREKLNGKRFLLVLDDVWSRSIGKWECMRNSLLEIGGAKGSKIIVTTRSMDVVSAMINFSTNITLQLGQLPQSELEFTKKEWESIEDSDIWSSLENGWASIKSYRTRRSFVNENGILRNLSLTFNRLPWHLKSCFAYCSIFPKGADIKKDELIQLWMAQGYLRPTRGPNLDMEDVGHDYFDILWRSSLFQDVEMDEYNNIETCKMHDHVHDLAVHVSKGHSLAVEPFEEHNSDVQHLSLEIWGSFPYPSCTERLRTLFLSLFSTEYLPKNFEHSSHTRALCLFGNDVQKLPSSIQKFIYLKYLDLSETSIEKLPNCIAKLYNLETLKLPWCLTELPTELHKLVRLRHFCITDAIETRKLMPMNLGQLMSLQTIPFFVEREEGSGHGIEELGKLSKLRGKLHVYDLQRVKDKEEAKKAFMLEKANIQELGFHWGESGSNSNNHEDVLEGLQPHRNVLGLILKCFPGLRFPSWMMNRDAQVLQNLVKVELRSCKRCEQIPTLGHLPALKVIEIVGFHNLVCIHPEFFGYNAGVPGAVMFPKLRKLTLDDLPNLVKWSWPASTRTTVFFPCLEELYIKGCPQLITIPSHLFSFQELTISSTNISSARNGNMHHPSLTISSSDCEKWKYASPVFDYLLTYVFENSSESLRKLTIRGLNELSCLPKTLTNLPSLEELAIIECSGLMSIANKSEGFNGLTSIRRLSIHRCEKLTFLPKGLLQRTLATLEMDSCPKLEMANPDELRSLTSLQSLTIRHCPTNLESLEHSWKKGLLCPSSLLRLEIGPFSKNLNYFPWPSAMSSVALRSLHLWGWEKVKHLPDELQNLCNFEGVVNSPVQWVRSSSGLAG